MDMLSAEKHIDDALKTPPPKVKRTYGRKKDAETSDFAGNSLGDSRARLDLSMRHEILEEAETSSGRNALDTPIDIFGWRKRLSEIDELYDNDNEIIQSNTRNIPVPRKSKGNSDASASQCLEGDDSFSGPDDSLLVDLAPPLTSSQSDPPPASPALTIFDSAIETFDSTKIKFPETGDCQFWKNAKSVEIPPLEDVQVRACSAEPIGSECDIVKQLPKERSQERPSGNVGSVLDEPSKQEVGSSKNSRRALRAPHGGIVKKLSRLEEKESKKAHARIMADQQVSVHKQTERFTIQDLLDKIQHDKPAFLKFENTGGAASSDPIQEFTSSPMLNSAIKLNGSTMHADEMNVRPSSAEEQTCDSSNERRGHQELEVKDEDKIKHLALAKRRVLAAKSLASQDDSDEDELEIVEEAKPARVKKHTDYEKRLALVAKFRLARQPPADELDGSQGDKAMNLAAKSTLGDSRTRRSKISVDHRSLQNVTFTRAAKQSAEMVREKEEEWQRRGGKLNGRKPAMTEEAFSIQRLAGELASREAKTSNSDQDGEHDHDAETDSDEDWESQREIQSRASTERDDEGHASDKDQPGDRNESGAENGKSEVQDLQERNSEDDQPDEPHSLKMHVQQRGQRRIVSDSEDEEIAAERNRPRTLVPDTSLIMDTNSHDSTDDENKENDNRLVFEHGEDRENVVIDRQPLFGSQGSPRRRNSGILSDSDGENRRPTGAQRRLSARKLDLEGPFSNDASPCTSPGLTTIETGSSPMLRPSFEATQLFSGGTPRSLNKQLGPSFAIQANSPDSDSGSREPHPLCVDSFSDLFASTAAKRRTSGSLQFGGELPLTMNDDLQPPLEVTTQIRRKASAIFEKEQDLLLEEAMKEHRKKDNYYVTENGLLTQTEPEGYTPVVYRSWTPSQGTIKDATSGSVPPSTIQRLPLSTLSLTSDLASPSKHGLTRLKKKKSLDDCFGDESAVLEDSPSRNNAFTVLFKAAREQKRREKRRLANSEFIEGEAVESDEDEMFGFGARSKDEGDDSGDDDLDANLEGLLDDTTMDAESLAENKVLEKVKEQFEQDDAELQKYHQAAIEGKFRSKRRTTGIGLDDSESEDEDEEARRRRLRMHKRRKIEGDALDVLGKDSKSRAYYDAYQKDVQEDDNDDFAHLGVDEMESTDDENAESQEVISTSEVRERLREAALRQTESEQNLRQFDPEDSDWMNPQPTSDDEFEVTEVEDVRKAPKGRALEQEDLMLASSARNHDDDGARQLAAWRKEQSGRQNATSSTRGVAVTGHSSKNRYDRATTSSSVRLAAVGTAGSQKARKKSSVLASLSHRQHRFTG